MDEELFELAKDNGFLIPRTALCKTDLKALKQSLLHEAFSENL